MENNHITIIPMNKTTADDNEAIRQLVKQIGDNYTEPTDEDITDMLSSSQTTLLAARDGERIVGMITVHVYRIPYVKKAYLDDLVVDKNYRGRGIAKELMEQAVAIAKEKGASYIDLTASPERVAGNNLYEKFGFKKRETNVYRLILNDRGL